MSYTVKTEIEKSLSHRWEQLKTKKTSILTYCEQYARWTLPYVFPLDSTSVATEALPIAQDSIGAKGTNHLANKIISTLFPAKSLFFRLTIDQEMRDIIEKAMKADDPAGDPDDLKQKLEVQVTAAEGELLKAEHRVEDHLDMVHFRPEAINVAKQLIITGNSLVYFPEDKSPVQVYNLRNFSVCRDVAGEVVEMMTRDQRAFETFSKDVQDQLTADAAFKRLHKGNKDYQHDTNVTIYTSVKLHDDGKYHVTQYADDVKLDVDASYTKTECRWVPLVWNMVQGEDYGRGLVADYAGAFHAINVLSNSLLNIAAVMGDIKIFVDPKSMIDINRLEASASGSYHAGTPDAIGTAKFDKLSEAQFIQAMIERYEKQIAAAFMLTSDLTRDAERVTAQEIQQNVDELETSNSGIYSRLAATWQYATAMIALHDTDFHGVGDGIVPKIITGMDSLSRAGEAYNIRLFMQDLAMLNTVPPEILAAIKKPQFIKVLTQLHEVDSESWIMTQTEMDQRAQAEADQQQKLEETKAQGGVQKEVAKGAVQGDQ